jgi:hypothetical protein
MARRPAPRHRGRVLLDQRIPRVAAHASHSGPGFVIERRLHNQASQVAANAMDVHGKG